MTDAAPGASSSAMDAMRDWLGEQFAGVGERFDSVDARLSRVSAVST